LVGSDFGWSAEAVSDAKMDSRLDNNFSFRIRYEECFCTFAQRKIDAIENDGRSSAALGGGRVGIPSGRITLQSISLIFLSWKSSTSDRSSSSSPSSVWKNLFEEMFFLIYTFIRYKLYRV